MPAYPVLAACGARTRRHRTTSATPFSAPATSTWWNAGGQSPSAKRERRPAEYNGPVNPYLDLTREFNRGGVRAIVSSGQAVVLHRLSVASKDGDWILREATEALAHVISVLGAHGARYRFGAPLDVRWLAGGWSAHLEFQASGVRLRTDFVTRPPRLEARELATLWREQERSDLPCVDPRRLIALKQTGRERDYAVIGELARRLTDPSQRLRAARSPDDLLGLAREQPALAERLVGTRPLLAHAIAGNRATLAAALDAERRALMDADVARLDTYRAAAERWATAWPALEREIHGLPLPQQHECLVARAADLLPFSVAGCP